MKMNFQSCAGRRDGCQLYSVGRGAEGGRLGMQCFSSRLGELSCSSTVLELPPFPPTLPSRPLLPSSPEVHWSSHLPLLSSPGAPALPSHPPLKFTGAPALPCRRPLPLSPPSSPRAHQRCAPRVLGEWEHRCDCISAPPRLARDLLSGLAELGSRLPSVHFRCPSVWLSSPLLFCCGFVFVVSDLKEQPSFFFRGFGAGW